MSKLQKNVFIQAEDFKEESGFILLSKESLPPIPA
jgi:hypothetical protein